MTLSALSACNNLACAIFPQIHMLFIYTGHFCFSQDHILIMGWDVLTLLSGETGLPVTSVMLQDCHPVAPPQVVDFTGDGWNDVIVTCPDK